MLTIWGRLNSHNVKKVAWFAEELAIPYRRHDIGGAFGMTDTYRALNPNGLIPTIEDDGLVLWESNAILRYLAARHPASGFWPADPAVRAIGDKWMDWQAGYADAQRDAFLQLVRHKPEDRDADVIRRSTEASAAQMAILDRALADRPWLSGDDFGIGDIPMGVYAYTWFSLDIARPVYRHLAGWYDRLTTRPGFAGQVMIPLS